MIPSVAHILGSLNTGGAEKLVLDSLSCLNKTAKGPYICVYRKSGELKENFENNQIRCFHINKKFFFDFAYLLKLRKRLTEQKINIVHAHQAIDALFAKLACMGVDIKVVLSVHCFDQGHSISASMIMKYIIKRTDLNIFVSNFQKQHYTSNYKLKSDQRNRVIYNGIALDRFESMPNSSIRDQLSIPPNVMLLGGVGSFISARDQMTICRFLNLLHNKKINFRYLFIGRKSVIEPWLYDDCVKYCKKNGFENNVFFLGTRDDVPAILSQLDAYIYSTVHDTFGLSVIEAIAASIPVFVNNWEVMAEITENGKHAILYETKNPQDLLVKFLAFLDSREAYVVRAREAAKAIRTKFSIQKHVLQLQEIYTYVLAKEE